MTLPVLDPAACVGCGWCAAACPTRCLAAGPAPGRPPWLPRPLDCVACGACEVICPVAAIRLTGGDPTESDP